LYSKEKKSVAQSSKEEKKNIHGKMGSCCSVVDMEERHRTFRVKMESELEKDEWWRRKTELREKHGGIDVLKELREKRGLKASIDTRRNDAIAASRVRAQQHLISPAQHQQQQQQMLFLRLENNEVVMVRVLSDNEQFTLPSPEFFGRVK
jgi:hypothetical protein